MASRLAPTHPRPSLSGRGVRAWAPQSSQRRLGSLRRAHCPLPKETPAFAGVTVVGAAAYPFRRAKGGRETQSCTAAPTVIAAKAGISPGRALPSPQGDPSLRWGDGGGGGGVSLSA